MGRIDLWLGPAGGGKTGKALQIFRAEMDQYGWHSVRYLVPTVGQKRNIEHLLIAPDGQPGLFGDPVTTFFNFAEEVARRAAIAGNAISELQKYLLLQQIVRETPLAYFERAQRYPGFVLALGETIDELKVHMVRPETVVKAAGIALERDSGNFAHKLSELAKLYETYQRRVYEKNLYDSEGIMWIAAEMLRAQPALFAELRCLVLDGFARLTPIQVDFLRALAPRVERIIVLFEFEGDRAAAYRPVQVSLDQLQAVTDEDALPITRTVIDCPRPPRTALEHLRRQIFREAIDTCPPDDSLQVFAGATPAHEAEMITREIRALLRHGRLADGTPVRPADIAVLARNADAAGERLARVFRRFEVPIKRDPPLLAHTPVGRAVLAVFRLLRDRWQREDVLMLLRSGMLEIDAATACRIDLVARSHYLRARRTTWLAQWPDDETRDALAAALQRVAQLDDLYHDRTRNTAAVMAGIEELARAFRDRALAGAPPLPDVDAQGADRFVRMEAAFSQLAQILVDLHGFSELLGEFRRDELLDVITTALTRERLPAPVQPAEGISVLPVHATGGEKFAVVFLCDLQEGSFPHHQRESAFFPDHEREEILPDLRIPIDPRRRLEDDERYWFLHALSSATHRLVLSYARHDAGGGPLERSSFFDEVERVVPALDETARSTSFGDVTPSPDAAEHEAEFLAALAVQLRTRRDAAGQAEAAAAYAGYPRVSGPGSGLAALFRRAQPPDPTLTAPAVLAHLAARARPYSASELQTYLDCPYLWFGRHCLGVEPVIEEFSPLDRGMILHEVMEKLYRSRQARYGEPVHLEHYALEELWPGVAATLHDRLDAEPRFANRPRFLQDIERDRFTRVMRRFLIAEIERARTRKTHPAFFELAFGAGSHAPLAVGDGGTFLRGNIDRVDLADDDPGQAVVVDYKTSSQSYTLNELMQGNVLQAPIYALAVERLHRRTPLGSEFLGFKQGDVKGVYRDDVKALYSGQRVRTLDADAWQDFLARSEARICRAADDIRAGRISIAPTSSRCPDTCPHLALCRGDRYQLARLVRNSKNEEPEEENGKV